MRQKTRRTHNAVKVMMRNNLNKRKETRKLQEKREPSRNTQQNAYICIANGPANGPANSLWQNEAFKNLSWDFSPSY